MSLFPPQGQDFGQDMQFSRLRHVLSDGIVLNRFFHRVIVFWDILSQGIKEVGMVADLSEVGDGTKGTNARAIPVPKNALHLIGG